MSERTKKYDLYLNTAKTSIIKVATAALREAHNVPDLFAFRYEEDYLKHPKAFPLDPATLPLSNQDLFLSCRGGAIPALLDDYLPDAWGRKVLAHLAFYRDKKRLSNHSPIDLLAVAGGNRIGAIQWVAPGTKPGFGLGADISSLKKAEEIAQAVANENFKGTSVDEHSLIYLANTGSGVGGARPKALVHDNNTGYLAKFNSLKGDAYNNARVELACLNMAKQAGLNVRSGCIHQGINGREVLLLERFDLDNKNRRHMVSVNGLIKLTQTQQDREGSFRYDDIAELIKKFSTQPKKDLEQLLRQMLFNAAINNTDDHERNFSFISNQTGYELSPAYDMVPSTSIGQYHVAGYQHHASPPKPEHIKGKAFGLSPRTVQTIAGQVIDALSKWDTFAEQANISEQDMSILSRIMRTR